MNKIAILLVLFLIVGLVNDGCAEDAYVKACKNCHFDEHGKMDKNCYDSYQQGGLSCIAATYPIATAKHSAGQCPQIDKCAGQLRTCMAAFNEFTDKENCEGGATGCFIDADHCIANAAFECGEKAGLQAVPCPTEIFLILSILVMAAWSSWLKNKK